MGNDVFTPYTLSFSYRCGIVSPLTKRESKNKIVHKQLVIEELDMSKKYNRRKRTLINHALHELDNCFNRRAVSESRVLNVRDTFTCSVVFRKGTSAQVIENVLSKLAETAEHLCLKFVNMVRSGGHIFAELCPAKAEQKTKEVSLISHVNGFAKKIPRQITHEILDCGGGVIKCNLYGKSSLLDSAVCWISEMRRVAQVQIKQRKAPLGEVWCLTFQSLQKTG